MSKGMQIALGVELLALVFAYGFEGGKVAGERHAEERQAKDRPSTTG
jgi:hypothetical protein